MSSSNIITLGYGSTGTPSMVVTLGYLASSAVDISASTGDWTSLHRNTSYKPLARGTSYQANDRKTSFNPVDRD